MLVMPNMCVSVIGPGAKSLTADVRDPSVDSENCAMSFNGV